MIDYIHEFTAPNGVESKCRIRVIDGLGFEKGMTVVIATQLEQDDAGMSVTNACENIATEIMLKFGIDPTRLIWIEHYTKRGCRGEIPESFDRVTFKTRLRGAHAVLADSLRTEEFRNNPHLVHLRLSNPQWTHRITRAEVVVATGMQP